jgi:SAM-dependent methyltransferase
VPDESLDAELTAYYEQEASQGRRSAHDDMRLDLRTSFAELLRAEGVSTLLDVGAGPGLDTALWQADGIRTVGVDLAHGNAVLMRRRGLVAVRGSLYRLPFRSERFDALWTMSTFVHVPHDRFDEAMAELIRVVRPGGPLAIGTWGGVDFEGRPGLGDLRPFRFFSLASHDRWHSMLSRHGAVEAFRTFQPTVPSGWEYQFAVLRPRA